MRKYTGPWAVSESGGEAFWLWAESWSDWKAYGAMNTVRELWGGILGDGQGHTVMGRRTGPWTRSGSNREACWAMGKVKERWGGIHGHGQGQAVVEMHTGP